MGEIANLGANGMVKDEGSPPPPSQVEEVPASEEEDTSELAQALKGLKDQKNQLKGLIEEDLKKRGRNDWDHKQVVAKVQAISDLAGTVPKPPAAQSHTNGSKGGDETTETTPTQGEDIRESRVTYVTHGKPSRKKTVGPEEFNYFYSNGTTLSDWVAHYFLNEGADAFGICETHVSRDMVPFRAKHFLKRWHLTAAPAQLSRDSKEGTYGGCWLGAKKHLGSQRMGIDQTVDMISYGKSSYVAGRCFRFRGVQIMIFCAYCRHGAWGGSF